MSGSLLLLAVILPVVIIGKWLPLSGGRGRRFMLFCLLSAACYLMLLAVAHYRGIELMEAQDQFDLDKNGLINGAELTLEAKQAILAATNDTGLKLAPITGFVYAVCWNGLVLLSIGGIRRRRMRRAG